jgi:large subunit ribosomal protein L16
MLMPKRTKHRKTHRGESHGHAYTGNYVAFGEYGLVALEPVWLDSRQIEAARRTITGYTKRGGKVWIRVFPDKPMTAKPAETRMGSGKGAPDHWVSVVKIGRVLFEIAGVKEDEAREALRLAGHKLPIRTRIVNRAESGNATPFDERFMGSKKRQEINAFREAQAEAEEAATHEAAAPAAEAPAEDGEDKAEG